jgi:hypothetical protein
MVMLVAVRAQVIARVIAYGSSSHGGERNETFDANLAIMTPSFRVCTMVYESRILGSDRQGSDTRWWGTRSYSHRAPPS